MRTSWVIAVVASLGSVFTAGCGDHAADKVCNKLIELREKAGKKVSDNDRKECAAQFERELKDCKNVSAVVDCIQGLTDYHGDDACVAKCRE